MFFLSTCQNTPATWSKQCTAKRLDVSRLKPANVEFLCRVTEGAATYPAFIQADSGNIFILIAETDPGCLAAAILARRVFGEKPQHPTFRELDAASPMPPQHADTYVDTCEQTDLYA